MSRGGAAEFFPAVLVPAFLIQGPPAPKALEEKGGGAGIPPVHGLQVSAKFVGPLQGGKAMIVKNPFQLLLIGPEPGLEPSRDLLLHPPVLLRGQWADTALGL